MRWAVAPLLLALAAGALGAQDAPVAPKASGRTLSERVELGEPFVHELTFEHPPAHRYELAAEQRLGPFELLSHERNRTDERGVARTTFRLKFAAFELGDLTCPELVFEVAEQGPLGTYSAPGPKVEVVPTVPPEASDQGASPKDIQPPLEVEIPSYRLVWMALGLVAAAALGALLYRAIKRRRDRRGPQGPPLALEVRTVQKLDALRAQDLPGQGRTREFYFLLSEIVRAYLGERYQFDALECTSSELLAQLGSRQTPGLPVDELGRFAEASDLAKFAQADVGTPTCTRDLELSYRLVRQTTPIASPAEGAAAP